MSNMVRLVVVRRDDGDDNGNDYDDYDDIHETKEQLSDIQLFSPLNTGAEIVNVYLCDHPSRLVKLRCKAKATSPPTFSLMLDKNPKAEHTSNKLFVKKSITDNSYWYDFIESLDSAGKFAAVCSAQINELKNFSSTIFIDVHAPKIAIEITSFPEGGHSLSSTNVDQPHQKVLQGSSVTVSCSLKGESDDNALITTRLHCSSKYNQVSESGSGSTSVFLRSVKTYDSPVSCTCVIDHSSCQINTYSR